MSAAAATSNTSYTVGDRVIYDLVTHHVQRASLWAAIIINFSLINSASLQQLHQL